MTLRIPRKKPVSAMAGFGASAIHARASIPGAGNAAGGSEVGFIALRTTGHERRPDPQARPHDRLVTRVGAQVASQRCPILRAGRHSLPSQASARANCARGI